MMRMEVVDRIVDVAVLGLEEKEMGSIDGIFIECGVI
jgi:hypothetical protein